MPLLAFACADHVSAGLACHHDLGLDRVSRYLYSPNLRRPRMFQTGASLAHLTLMADLDCCARHRPTESLILPNKRRFFPFRIPNLFVSPLLMPCLPLLTRSID